MHYKNILTLIVVTFASLHSHTYAEGDHATYLIAAGLLGATANYVPFEMAYNVEERDQKDLSWNAGVGMGAIWGALNMWALYILTNSMNSSKIEREIKANCYLTYLLGAIAGIALPISRLKHYSKSSEPHKH